MASRLRSRLLNGFCYFSAIFLASVVAAEFLAAIAVMTGRSKPSLLYWAIAWGVGLTTQLGLLIAPSVRRRSTVIRYAVLALCLPWSLFLSFTAIEASFIPDHLLNSIWLVVCAVWGAGIHGWAVITTIRAIRQRAPADAPEAPAATPVAP